MEKKQLFEDKIFTIDNLLTKEECHNWIVKAEKKGFNKSSISGGGHGRTGREDPRTSQFVVFMEDNQANQIWNKVKEFIPKDLSHLTQTAYITSDAEEWYPVGVNPRFRIYKYEKGEAFPEHIDYKMQRTLWKDKEKYKQRTYMTLLIYLNEEFTDGQTGFWTQHDVIGVKEHCRFLRGIEHKPHQVVVQPKLGMALINDQNILHEGIPPGKGVKYVLRTDIIHEKHIKLHPKLERKENEVCEWEKMFETSCKNYAD